MPLQATSGAASYDAFGGGVPVEPVYIEQIFSTYLYTGNQTARSITNGIDLSTKGGLVWIKDRTQAYSNGLFDTARGVQKRISSNSTSATQTTTDELSAFNVDGFSLGNNSDQSNATGDNYASWTFRKQPKFFDIVTWTGNGSTQTIAHSLNAAPSVVIIKCTSSTGNWSYLYNFGASLHNGMFLNLTDAAYDSSYNSGNRFSQRPTSTNIFLGSEGDTNTNGATYVAYLFASNAGGFGLTGTDNVITCGSFTGSNNLQVTLGWEPQFIIAKRTNSSENGDWFITDNMRGWNVGDTPKERFLLANSSVEESLDSGGTNPYGNCESWQPNATGFQIKGFPLDSGDFIYIAIRRGPMKVPTSGTSVFSPILSPSSDALGTQKTTNFPVDMQLYATTEGGSNFAVDRLRGVTTTASNGGKYLYTNATDVEGDGGSRFWNSTGFQISNTYQGLRTIYWNFRRAPSFFDEVCYTGTGSARTVTHNLGVVPELMIVKSRSTARAWRVYSSAVGNTGSLRLNSDAALDTGVTAYWNNTTPTSSVFTVGTDNDTNASGTTYVAYLFSTCAGVSKVGSYTGTATTKQIDCGFTGGARFVLIKRTDASGDWYVWDTARGIVSGNDPYLLLNTTDAEVTNTDYIDTYSAGFEISSSAPSAINASGGTFIFLAIA